MFKRYDFSKYDFKLLILVIMIGTIGVIAINSAADSSSFSQKQTIGLILGISAMIAVSLINYSTIASYQWILYVLNIIMLGLVPIIGVTRNNATRWISLGFTNFQPSELAKFVMVIFIAKYLSDHKEDINKLKTIVSILVLVAIPTFLIKQQPDLSTSLVFIFLVIISIFTAGIDYRIVLRVILVTIPMFAVIVLYIMNPNQKLLESYQRDRVMALLYPDKYAAQEYYQQGNSILAIGSGQLTGKGLNNNTITSVKGANFLSEQQTDFIFAVIGEELGFIGSVFILCILFMIIIECIFIARDARDLMGKMIATGVAAIFTFQSFINIGVATAILPNTGIPLPFISYGLTSLICNMIGIGLVLNVGLQRRRYY